MPSIARSWLGLITHPWQLRQSGVLCVERCAVGLGGLPDDGVCHVEFVGLGCKRGLGIGRDVQVNQASQFEIGQALIHPCGSMQLRQPFTDLVNHDTWHQELSGIFNRRREKISAWVI